MQTAADAYRLIGLNPSVPELAWSHDNVLYYLDKGDELPLTLRSSQLKTLRRACLHDRWGVFDEPGTGKSIIAQLAAEYRMSYGNKAMVLMPPRLMTQFYLSHQLAFKNSPHKVHVLTEGPREREALSKKWDVEGWPDMLMMSYELFTRLCKAPKNDVVRKKATGLLEVKEHHAGGWRERLFREYLMLICDEAQKIKNYESNVHRAVDDFLERPEAGYLPMTGTPIQNTLVDAYGHIHLLNPTTYYNYREFAKKHIDTTGSTDRESIKIFKDIPTITANLYKNASRTLKREAMPDLPKARITEVPVELEKWHYKLYREMVNQRVLELEDTIIDLTTAQALRMACLRMVMCPESFADNVIDDTKNHPNAVMDLIDELLEKVGFDQPPVDANGFPILRGGKAKRKVVLFAHFNDSVVKLLRKYEGQGAVALYGGSSQRQAKEAEDRFKRDPQCPLFIANPESGGVGLNLQGYCSTVVFAEPVSVPGRFQQACDRVDRSGQTESPDIYIVKALRTSAVGLIKGMYRKAEDLVRANRDRDTLLRDLLGM